MKLLSIHDLYEDDHGGLWFVNDEHGPDWTDEVLLLPVSWAHRRKALRSEIILTAKKEKQNPNQEVSPS